MNDIQLRIVQLQEKGWTLAAIARGLNVTVNAVEKWKAGNRYPANSKAILMLLESLSNKKRIPKKKRYTSSSPITTTIQEGETMNETVSENNNELPAIFKENGGEKGLTHDPDRGTFWATQEYMANLFEVDRSVVSKHISSIFSDEELDEMNNVQKMHIDTSKKPVNSYTLDVILSVGYRVNSKIATKFRQWATQKLNSFILEGAVLDEDKLSANPELQRKIAIKLRRLRTSEVSAYAQVREVFKLSASDYDKESQSARTFFSMAQDKFHYAVTHKTAAEIKLERADSLKNNMGLITIQGKQPTLQEARIAKNYLAPDELRALENISEQFLLFAEAKAFRGQKMMMEELSHKVNTLLEANDYKVLYEYKEYLASEADRHVKKVFTDYQAQLTEGQSSRKQLPESK